MNNNELKEMNKKIKAYLNESKSISIKCRNKLIKLVEKYFYVDLPKDNYLNIDITILENGNIIMREEEYKTKQKTTSSMDLVNRFTEFQKEVDILLNKNETNFKVKKQNSELKNIIVLFLMVVFIIFLFLYGLRELLLGNLFGVIWLIIIIVYYIVPLTGDKLRNRIIRAKKFLKNKFTKK